MTRRVQSRGTACAKFLKWENLEHQRKKEEQWNWKSRQWPLRHIKESGLYLGGSGETAEELWAKRWCDHLGTGHFQHYLPHHLRKTMALKAIELLSKITLLSLFHSFKLSVIYTVVVEMSKNGFIFLGRMRSCWNLHWPIRRKERLQLS